MKQVIIIRKDLNMRKGKMVAQGAHASLEATLNSINTDNTEEWLNDGMKKIVVSCDSEEELLELYRQAGKIAGIPRSKIRDAGLTEFKEPTLTAVAIGPAKDAVIDKITGELKLL